MKMQFTPAQKAAIREAANKERLQATARRKQTERTILGVARCLKLQLRKVPGLDPSLQEMIATKLAPYVQKQRSRAANAFARSH